MMDVSILLAVPVPGWMHSGHIRRHSYPFFSTRLANLFSLLIPTLSHVAITPTYVRGGLTKETLLSDSPLL